MKVMVAKQSVGKRRPIFVDYELPDDIPTLRILIEAFVAVEVERFNTHVEEGMVSGEVEDPSIDSTDRKPLLEEAIWAEAAGGKVGFGAHYHGKIVPLNRAIDTAILGFQDGLYRVFIDEEEVEKLEECVSLKEGSKVAFIRLTFLAGRRW